MPEDGSVQFENLTNSIGVLVVSGPKARTLMQKIYVKNIKDWEAIAQVHGERFKDILPANTLVKARLVGTEYLVEIEADAILN